MARLDSRVSKTQAVAAKPSQRVSAQAKAATFNQLPVELCESISRHANDKTFFALMATSHGLRQLPSPADLTARLKRNFAAGYPVPAKQSKEQLLSQLRTVMRRGHALRQKIRAGNDTIADPLPVAHFALHPSGDTVAIADHEHIATSHPLLPDTSIWSAFLSLLPPWMRPKLGYIPMLLEEHSDAIRFVQYSQDGRFLATGLSTGRLQVQDLTDHSVQEIRIPDLSVAFTPQVSTDAKYALMVSTTGTIHHWDLTKPTAAEQRLEGTGLRFVPHRLQMSSDGRFVAARGGARQTGTHPENLQLFLWDTSQEMALPQRLHVSGEEIRDFEFSPSAKLLATASDNGWMRLWDPRQPWFQTTAWFGHESPVYQMVFSHDESLLATASDDRNIRVWDLRATSPKIVFDFPSHDRWLGQLSFSPNDHFLLAEASPTYGLTPDGPTSRFHAIRGWDLARQDPLPFERYLTSLSTYDWQFSPDSQFVMIRDDDRLRMWELPHADES